MKKLLLCIVFLLPLFTYAQDSLYFATRPTLSPDAKDIYFCYDGGIWKVSSTGGTASRVTAMTGYERSPKISPDGKWLAFSSNEQGNNDVYITPTNGGNIKQLTFHQSSDIVSSWSADSKFIYFESGRYNDNTTYKVSIDGGTPERLFSGYFNTVVNLVENPTDKKYYFNTSSESYDSPTRKGYKGDNNPNIKSWDPAQKQFVQLTTYRGKDIWPSVDKNGNLYWATDELNNEYNIAILENGKPRILTSFNDGIQYPQVSYNGEKIVFNKGYVIHLYDVASGKVTVPQIKIYDNNLPDIAKSYQIEGNISACDVSPDGKKLAFVSRGLLFISDNKGLYIRPVNTNPKERVMEVKWAKDNKTIYYTRTNTGWYNLYKISAETRSGEKLVYAPQNMIKNLTISNDRSSMAFVTGSNCIEMINLKNDKVEKLADNEFWSLYNYSIEFSGDDKFLAYTAMNLFEQDVFIFDIKNKKSFNLTNSATVENSPTWSADGKHLYLVANRYAASYPRGTSSNLYRIKLNYTDKPYTTEKYDELFKNDSAKKAKKATFDITFDMNDINRRWEMLQYSGKQWASKILKSGTKNFLLYASNHEGSTGIYVQELLDFDQKPARKISGITSIHNLSYNGSDLYSIERGAVYSVDLNGGSAKKIELKQNFVQNNRNEFSQMFNEVWALISGNFYDPTFHGVNWENKRDTYLKYLPHVKSRSDFREMVNDMLGELNASHLGFHSSGAEERNATYVATIETGIVFNNKLPYTVEYILKDSPAFVNEQKPEKGDELIAVNALEIDKSKNREYYFASPASDREITLTFRRGKKEFDVTMHTMPSHNIKNLFYTQWEDDCRKRVNDKTGGRIAYHHMRAMGDGDLNNFLIDMSTDAVHKDALILDLRYNNGGNVHNEVLEFLNRKSHFTWKHRNHPNISHPNVTPSDKPIVVLINERSLSDAEVTSNGIQSLGIGKLIGTETYRWIIFTSGTMLVDGSFCRLPGWGCYNLKGEDMEFSGVSPDIYVKNIFTDRLNGNDPQLDRAIEEILKELTDKK